jgi:hypothetical protein
MLRKAYSNSSDGLVFLSHPTQPLVGLPVNRARLSDELAACSSVVVGQPPVDLLGKKLPIALIPQAVNGLTKNEGNA